MALTKEEKFQFILDNVVEIVKNTTSFINKDLVEHTPKYYAVINGIGYPGYELEDAIDIHIERFSKVSISGIRYVE